MESEGTIRLLNGTLKPEPAKLDSRCWRLVSSLL
jgi:hypothetical protein